MKSFLSFFAVLIFVFCSSQKSGYTIVYKATYKAQKGNASEKVEYMALEVKDLKSKFYNLDLKKQDSLVAINDSSIKDDTEIPNLKFTVFKDVASGKTLVSSLFNQAEVTYQEEPLQYKMKKNDELLDLGSYKVKTANLDFGGRKWIIQYIPDIPIFDGPYVFSGLPGLVFQAITIDLEYDFKLISITKNPDMKVVSLPNANVKKEVYAKKLQEFKKDPAHQNIIYKNIWGDRMEYVSGAQSPQEIIELEKQFQKIIGKFDNPIDKGVFLLNF